MTSEELSDEDLRISLRVLGGSHQLLTLNRGDLFMPKEIQDIGTGFLIC
jgi:hypothetical protein